MRSFKYLLLLGSCMAILMLGCNWLTPFAPDCTNDSFCSNGVDINFQGQRLEAYSVQLQVSGEKPLIFSCPQPMTLYTLGSDEFPVECRPDGISWLSFAPNEVSLTINWSGGSVKEDLHLEYLAASTSVAGCPSQCKRATVEVSFKTIGTPVAALIPTPTATPLPIVSKVPQGQLTVVGEEKAGDWLVYQTPDLYSIALDGNYLWAGGTGGLLRWDRTTGDVLHYLAPQTPLPDNGVNGVLLHDGQLYISTDTAVAIFDRKDKWTIFTNQDMGLGTGSGNSIALANDELWVANKTGLAHRTRDGQWQVIKAGPDTFAIELIDRIVAQPDGLYIEGAASMGDTEDVTYRYVDGRWEKLNHNLPDGIVAPDGIRWKSDRHEVYRSKDDGLTWQLAFEWPDFITLRAVDEQGRLYLTTESTVLVLDGDRFTEAYRFTDVGPELNYINIIQGDAQGRMWFATDGRGLTMFDGQRWRNWQPETRPEMRHDAIRGLAVTDRQIFAGGSGSAGDGGVMVYDIAQDRWTSYWPGESELSGGGVEGIAINHQGQAYLPTANGILDVYDKGQWQHIKMPMSRGYVLITSEGVFDADNNYWLGTDGFGLWKYDGKRWKVYDTRSSNLSSDTINALGFDGYGQLWALTGSGLAVQCSAGQWKEFPIPNISEQIYFGDVVIDSQNRIWVTANFDSFAVYNGQDWLTFAPEIVGESMWDDALAFDSDGRMWASTSNGVAIFQGRLDLPAPRGAESYCANSPTP